jgi:hypothetical protein
MDVDRVVAQTFEAMDQNHVTKRSFCLFCVFSRVVYINMRRVTLFLAM